MLTGKIHNSKHVNWDKPCLSLPSKRSLQVVAKALVLATEQITAQFSDTKLYL